MVAEPFQNAARGLPVLPGLHDEYARLFSCYAFAVVMLGVLLIAFFIWLAHFFRRR